MNPETKITATADLLGRKMSLFALVTSNTTSQELTVQQLLHGIRDGRWRDEVEPLRETYRDQGRDAYKKARATSLQAVTVSGVFRRRAGNAMERHSGLVAVDLDNLGDKLAATRQAVIDSGLALAVFMSPSGDGLKVLLPVDANDATTHRPVYEAALAAFKHIGAEADSTCRDPSRLCFVSYDPDIWVTSSPSLPLLSATTPTPTATPCTLHPTPYTLHPTIQSVEGDEGLDVAARVDRLKRLEREQPALAQLYRQHVVRRLSVEVGNRNGALTELVPYLFRAVGDPVARELVGLALELNRDTYKGSMHEQMTSLRCLWEGCEQCYVSELTRNEATVYDRLEPEERAAFRIMRDLAIAGGGQFFMSCDQLRERVGGGVNGWRMLNQFSGGYGLIEKVKAGTRREKGQAGRAAYWRWRLPLPAGDALVSPAAA